MGNYLATAVDEDDTKNTPSTNKMSGGGSGKKYNRRGLTGKRRSYTSKNNKTRRHASRHKKR